MGKMYHTIGSTLTRVQLSSSRKFLTSSLFLLFIGSVALAEPANAQNKISHPKYLYVPSLTLECKAADSSVGPFHSIHSTLFAVEKKKHFTGTKSLRSHFVRLGIKPKTKVLTRVSAQDMQGNFLSIAELQGQVDRTDNLSLQTSGASYGGSVDLRIEKISMALKGKRSLIRLKVDHFSNQKQTFACSSIKNIDYFSTESGSLRWSSQRSLKSAYSN